MNLRRPRNSANSVSSVNPAAPANSSNSPLSPLRNFSGAVVASVVASITSIAAVAILLASQSAHATELKTLILNDTLPTREGKAYQYDKAMQGQSHTDLKFEIDPNPQIRAGQIEVRGWLFNSSPSTRLVYLSGRDPLTLEVKPNDSVQLRKDAAQPKTRPLYVVDIPPNTKVQVTGVQRLEDLNYQGSPQATLKYTFGFWTAPRPSGDVSVQLPARTSADMPKFKIEIERFDSQKDQSAKLVASLKNISSEPQTFCTVDKTADSVDWKLLNGNDNELEREAAARDLKSKTAPNETKANVLKQAAVPTAASDCQTIPPETSIELATASLKEHELRANKTTFRKIPNGMYQLKVTVHNAIPTTVGPTSASTNGSLAAPNQSPTQKIEATLPLKVP